MLLNKMRGRCADRPLAPHKEITVAKPILTDLVGRGKDRIQKECYYERRFRIASTISVRLAMSTVMLEKRSVYPSHFA